MGHTLSKRHKVRITRSATSQEDGVVTNYSQAKLDNKVCNITKKELNVNDQHIDLESRYQECGICHDNISNNVVLNSPNQGDGSNEQIHGSQCKSHCGVEETKRCLGLQYNSLTTPVNQHTDSSHGGQLVPKLRSLSNVQALQTVRDAWVKIDGSICRQQIKSGVLDHSQTRKGWKVVRLFVSSTFNDFHAERELLVKKVVPELKEWCESRRLHFIECDLRWGIPKDSTTEDTVSICLDELDLCKKETHGEPFFLSLLGDRYGWIPDEDMMSADFKEKYNWIFPLSITHMEIVYGALRTKSQNAAFLVRESDFICNLPKSFCDLWKEQSSLAKEHLKALKTELGKRFPKQVFGYKCSYGGTEYHTGMEKVKLNGLEEEFAPKVVQFFKDAIEKYYPPREMNEETEADVVANAQDKFVEMRGQLVIGRDEEVKEIRCFVDQSNDDYIQHQQLLLIIGDPGIGKSSLLAKITVGLQENQSYRCMYNFASAGMCSTNSVQVLERFMLVLGNILGIDPPEGGYGDYDSAVPAFHKQLNQFAESRSGETLIILLDAINQFQDGRDPYCDWLPLRFPRNVRVIISSTEGQHSNIIRKKYEGRVQEVSLKTFDDVAGKQLVQAQLGRYNKKLDEQQLRALVSSPGAGNPLWLSLTCEELRVFGVFETVSQKIASFPDNIDDLLEMIVTRLVVEDETGVLKDILTLLQCSVNGLTETDLRTILSNDHELLPMIIWARCKRSLRFLLINTGSRQDEETFSFFHNSVAVAVRRLFLSEDDKARTECHMKLADYFDKHCTDQKRVLSELPMHLKYARDLKRLQSFLRTDKRSLGLDLGSKQYFYQLLRCPVRHFGAKDNFASPVYICQLCSVKRGAFSFFPQPNKEMCCVCGNVVPFKNDESLAFVCHKHKSLAAPGTTKCFICDKIIFLNQTNLAAGSARLYLCLLCRHGNRCVKFIE